MLVYLYCVRVSCGSYALHNVWDCRPSRYYMLFRCHTFSWWICWCPCFLVVVLLRCCLLLHYCWALLHSWVPSGTRLFAVCLSVDNVGQPWYRHPAVYQLRPTSSYQQWDNAARATLATGCPAWGWRPTIQAQRPLAGLADAQGVPKRAEAPHAQPRAQRQRRRGSGEEQQ